MGQHLCKVSEEYKIIIFKPRTKPPGIVLCCELTSVRDDRGENYKIAKKHIKKQKSKLYYCQGQIFSLIMEYQHRSSITLVSASSQYLK
jgi:hypothetical protein